ATAGRGVRRRARRCGPPSGWRRRRRGRPCPCAARSPVRLCLGPLLVILAITPPPHPPSRDPHDAKLTPSSLPAALAGARPLRPGGERARPTARGCPARTGEI